MSDLPPPPASVPPPPPPASPVDPRSQVTGPAYGLIIVGVIYALYSVLMLVLNLLGMGINVAGGNMGGFQMASGIWGVGLVLLNLLVAGLVAFGGMQMLKLRNYNLALAGAIAGMLPCGYCCCLGLGVGIWAIVILMKPEVKAAFTP